MSHSLNEYLSILSHVGRWDYAKGIFSKGMYASEHGEYVYFSKYESLVADYARLSSRLEEKKRYISELEAELEEFKEEKEDAVMSGDDE